MYKILRYIQSLTITSSKASLKRYLSVQTKQLQSWVVLPKTSHYISKQLWLIRRFFFLWTWTLSVRACHALPLLCLLQFHGVYLQDIHALLTSTLPCCLSARAFFPPLKKKKWFFLLLLESTKMISFKITIHSILYIPYTRNAVCSPPFPALFFLLSSLLSSFPYFLPYLALALFPLFTSFIFTHFWLCKRILKPWLF